MKACFLISVLALSGCCVLSKAGRTDGCLMPPDKDWRIRREKALINEPDQKALIYFRDGEEQLVISPSFEGASGDFAWVVPVPARPKVEVLKGAPFHELARLVEPAPPRGLDQAPAAGGRTNSAVTVLERRTVGDYDVSVLAATDADALLNWLKENRYHLPTKATAPMQSYIQEGWTFVACRIKAPKSAHALHMGTLTPLRLIFPAPKPIYPMRLSAANPQSFTVLIYLVMPQTALSTQTTPVVMPAVAPGESANQPLSRTAVFLQAQRSAFPTLARLSRSNLDVYLVQSRFRPEECRKDFVWNMPMADPSR